MQVVSIQSAQTSRARSNTKNDKFANDGSYESVEALLHKLATKCYARVEKLGLGMNFDDVLQQMKLHYWQAKQKWNPEGGARFSTYCQTVCMNNFNNAIEKPERERTIFGMVSYAEATSSASNDGDAADPLEFMETGEVGHSPEDSMVAKEELMDRLASLSQGSRRLVTALLTDERRRTLGPDEAGPNMPGRLRDLAKACGLHGDELKQVKEEILVKFGVRWN